MSSERREGQHASQEMPGGKRAYRDSDAQQLVEGLRRNDTAALGEFIRRYQRFLFDRARRLGCSRERCEDAVLEVIEDVAARLLAGTLRTPKSLDAYMVVTFRRRLGADAARRNARNAVVREEAADAFGSGERVVLSLCSQGAIRDAHGPDPEDGAPPPAPVMRLAAHLVEKSTEDERQLLLWASHLVPLRVIAGWLGINYAATATRLSRLRARLRATARVHLASLPVPQREEAERFLAGRARTPPPAQVAAGRRALSENGR